MEELTAQLSDRGQGKEWVVNVFAQTETLNLHLQSTWMSENSPNPDGTLDIL